VPDDNINSGADVNVDRQETLGPEQGIDEEALSPAHFRCDDDRDLAAALDMLELLGERVHEIGAVFGPGDITDLYERGDKT
jgi:hypothetical protein